MQSNSLLNNHQPDIGLLLEKYFEGETTIEEEKALKAYFNAPGVAPEHQAMAPLFQMLRNEKAAVMPEREKVKKPGGSFWLGSRMMAAAATMLLLISAAAWWWSTRPIDPVSDQPVAVAPKQKNTEPRQEEDSTLRWNDKMATVTDQSSTQSEAKTSDSKPLVNQKRKHKARKQAQPVLASQVDPETEEAMEEIKAAFQLISAKINKGRKEATKGLKEIEHMEKGIEKIKENS